jgi:hypothetical protein
MTAHREHRSVRQVNHDAGLVAPGIGNCRRMVLFDAKKIPDIADQIFVDAHLSRTICVRILPAGKMDALDQRRDVEATNGGMKKNFVLRVGALVNRSYAAALVLADGYLGFSLE